MKNLHFAHRTVVILYNFLRKFLQNLSFFPSEDKRRDFSVQFLENLI